MKKSFILFCFILLSMILIAEERKLNIVTTTTDLAWICEKVGGGKVDVISLLDGTEDPHFIDALPSYVRKASKADLVCSVGLGLEIGWLPAVLKKTGKKEIQLAGKGYIEIGAHVEAIEIPLDGFDRSMGDVHPEGNPHFWLSPSRMRKACELVCEKLIELNPEHTNYWRENLKKVNEEIQTLSDQIKKKLESFDGTVVQYHKDFSYFFDEFGIKSYGAIEEKPGVMPSAGRLAKFGLKCKENKICCALASCTTPEKKLEKFKEISGVRYQLLYTSIQKNGEVNSYEALMNQLVEAILNK